jgi:hypothetical protein
MVMKLPPLRQLQDKTAIARYCPAPRSVISNPATNANRVVESIRFEVDPI